jgi:hypothetical protein
VLCAGGGADESLGKRPRVKEYNSSTVG